MGLEEQSEADISTNRYLYARVALLRSRAVIGIVSGVVLAWLGNGPPKYGVQKPRAWANLEAPIKWESTPRLHRRRLEAKYTVKYTYRRVGYK